MGDDIWLSEKQNHVPLYWSINTQLLHHLHPILLHRHQYYQLQNRVTVDVYAKNIAKEAVSCNFSDTHLTFTIRDIASGEEEYKLDVELYGKVIPSASKVRLDGFM